MESYRIQLFLHILAVVLGLGVTFVYPFLQAFAERQGVNATRSALRFMRRLENIVVIPGAILVLVFGISLIFDDRTGYTDDFPGWLMVAIAWYVIAMAAGIALQRKGVTDALNALEGAEADNALPVKYVEIARRMQMIGGLFGLSIIGILFMMVWGAEGGF